MYTEELGYGSTYEVEALETEFRLSAMRSQKYACCWKGYVDCYHGYMCMSWGSQILTSWRGEWLECLHAYGTFKFQVTFRVEVHQLGHVTHFKEGGSLNETLNRVVFTACLLFGCVSAGVCLEWKGWGELAERKS